jgi:hypothetical protein
MRISFALATTAILLLSMIPARARTIYRILSCRVFVDTDYTQIAEHVGRKGASIPASYSCGLQGDRYFITVHSTRHK